MPDDQSAAIALLSAPETYGAPEPVTVVETHGAYVFLCGDTALKLKRAVVYDYMDLGTPAKRHAMLERELELNRPAAPTLYRDVIPITRQPDGALALDGGGAPVDWVLRMNRFPAECELCAITARGALDEPLATALGHAIAAYHAACPTRSAGGSALIEGILDELGRVFAEFRGAPVAAAAEDWLAAARVGLRDTAALLDARGREGSVRRAHGDLHLRNIVVLEGRPVLFDALEFDETLGTCDLLYDLAFLLMDLCHRDLHRAACRVLDAWLLDFRGAQDAGLAGLPLFLSVRAAIRAMVLLQSRRAAVHGGESPAEAAHYIAEARAYLSPPPPVLVAVGGFSGSGKSVLARDLAPHLGAAPGAVWLATDLLRKAGLEATRALDEAAYAPQARAAVYDTALQRARQVLGAGHAALLDATFLDPSRRDEARALAADCGVPFVGLWLDAPEAVLEQRVRNRTGDPSDAGPEVLARQLAKGAGAVDWVRLDAAGTPAMTRDRAREAIAARLR